MAPDWSPYRFGFNNPVLNFDPLGLFESREEARRHKRDYELKGRIRRQSDGTYAIENRRDHSSIFEDPELGIVKAALALAPRNGYTGLLGGDRREPYQGFWGGLTYLWTGGIENGIRYNRDGYPLGPAPSITMPPPVGPIKGINIETAKWAQKTFSSIFSEGGKFAGQTIDDVASALRSGKLQTMDIPIDVIVREGNTLILNTRSSVALIKAGIPRSNWNVVNRTGQEFYENLLSAQLQRNKLSNAGTNIIRQSGTRNVITN